ncbi:MAG TPA: protoporphyrinogen oxidase [Pyrinomonadaceae bacterium]
MKRVVIIGGGISGLAAAHRLLERDAAIDLTLLESSSRLGGIVRTDERDGFLLERGPDSFISEKPAALDLVRRLDLASRLIETNDQHRRSFVVRQARLLPVPEGFHLLAPARVWPFLKTDIFSWPGKARMALEFLLPRRSLNGRGAPEDESLADFVRRRFGREALERMAQPMVGGIYTADPEKLSLRATMPRFLDMERDSRSIIRALICGSSPTVREGSGSSPTVREGSDTSGARYSLFLSFDRGMQVLTDALAARVSQRATVKLNTTANSLARVQGGTGWEIKTARDEMLIADAVCLALPAYTSARLLRAVDADLAAELQEISYASSATINLAYKRQDLPHALDGFGFVVPFIERRSIMACSFSSVKFAGRAPVGQVLLRAFAGGALQPEMFELNDSELLARVRADLRDLLGIREPPLFAEVSKWPRSMPQYHLGHLERVQRIKERAAALQGLVLAGNAYSGLGIPDCISSGEAAAERIQAASSSSEFKL